MDERRTRVRKYEDGRVTGDWSWFADADPRPLPCPFCGADRLVIEEHTVNRSPGLAPAYFVNCDGCRANGSWEIAASSGETRQTIIAAVAAWNRAPRYADERNAAIVERDEARAEIVTRAKIHNAVEGDLKRERDEARAVARLARRYMLGYVISGTEIRAVGTAIEQWPEPVASSGPGIDREVDFVVDAP